MDDALQLETMSYREEVNVLFDVFRLLWFCIQRVYAVITYGMPLGALLRLRATGKMLSLSTKRRIITIISNHAQKLVQKSKLFESIAKDVKSYSSPIKSQ